MPLAIAIEKTHKYNLVGYDHNEGKIAKIKKQISPLEDDLVKKELKKYPIEASTDEKIIKGCDIYIIAVPTPVHDDHSPDYGPVKGATRSIAKYLKKGDTVVLESTVNPGTCEEIVLPILEKKSRLKGGVDFNLTHCPERINPGDPKWNVYNIPRNIGSLDPIKNKEISDFYRSFLEGKINEVSSLKIAESTKIIENTFRDINIAYVNELAKSFDKMGIDLIETIKASSNKPFGYMPHWPGAGVGGHCIAVDPYYLIRRAAKAGFNHRFLKRARKINNSMPEYAIKRLEIALREADKVVQDTTVLVLGLAYKGDVADLRESPAMEILKHLKQHGFTKVLRYDPFFPDMSDANDLEEALSKTDTILIATAHSKFKEITPSLLKKSGVKVVIDGRNMLDKAGIIKNGIIYKGIGR